MSVYVIGEGTSFDGTSVVTMGAGITVNSSVAISTTALEVSLTASPTATLGARTVSVTTGTTTLTLVGGLKVTPSVTVTPLVGTLQQGGSVVARVTLAAGKVFGPALSGSAFVVGNATFTSPTPGLSVLSNRWVSSDTADVVVSVSPFTSITASADLVVTFSDGQATETATNFASIAPNLATTLVLGAPVTDSLSSARDVALFQVSVASAPAVVRVAVTPAMGALLSPRLRAYRSSQDVPDADVAGASLAFYAATAGNYLVSVADVNNGGAMTGYGFSMAIEPFPTAEVEPNDTIATATAFNSLGGSVTGALTAANRDFYSFQVFVPGVYQFSTQNTPTGVAANTRLTVCSGAATTCDFSGTDVNTANLSQDEDLGPGAYSTTFVTLDAGTYLLAVDVNTTVGDYVLSSSQVATTPELEPNDSAASATALTLGAPNAGVISSLTDKDWWVVDITTAGVYTVQTRPRQNSTAGADNLDTQVWICTETAALANTCTYTTTTSATTKIASDDDTGIRNYSSANPTLPVGRYYVGVQPFSSATNLPGNYFLVVTPQ